MSHLRAGPSITTPKFQHDPGSGGGTCQIEQAAMESFCHVSALCTCKPTMMQEFTATAILAYECGYSEGHVREEVQAVGSATLGSDLLQVRQFLYEF